MIRVLAPKLGETIDDGACGSAGFLCEAYDYLRRGSDVARSSDFEPGGSKLELRSTPTLTT